MHGAGHQQTCAAGRAGGEAGLQQQLVQYSVPTSACLFNLCGGEGCTIKLVSLKINIYGPGGSPAVGGRELSWSYFNVITVLTLPNYNLKYTLPHTIGISKIIQV